MTLRTSIYYLIYSRKHKVISLALTLIIDKISAAALLHDIQSAAPPTNVLFGRVTSNRVVFVIDVSGSMSNSFITTQAERIDRLSFTTRQLKSTIATLPVNAEFYIIAYASDVFSCFPDVVPLTVANITAAYNWCDRLQPLDLCNTLGALQAAMHCRPKTLLLLTDGEPDQLMSDVVDWVGTNIPSDVLVTTIAFLLPEHDKNAVSFMRNIAHVTNGNFRCVEGEF